MPGELKIRSSGAGPDLVMLHGWAMHSGIWAEAAEDLSSSFRVHLVDLPGHGINCDSTIPFTLDAICDSLLEQLPGARWLGWSLGGLIALAAALRAPGQISGLVLVATSACFVSTSGWPLGIDKSVFAQFAEDLEVDMNGTLKRFLGLEVLGSKTARQQLRRLTEVISQAPKPRLQALRAGLAVLQNQDFSAVLDKISCPSLLIGGSRDRLVAAAAIQETAKRLAEARVAMIDGSGHAPFIGHRREFVDLVCQFEHSLSGVAA